MKKISPTAAIYLFSILLLVVFFAIKAFHLSPQALKIVKAIVALLFVTAGVFLYNKKRRRHGS